MAFLPSSLLLLIYASTQFPQASQAFPYLIRSTSNFRLSSELTNFIPKCAQTCFISFLNVNYNSSQLGASPSLDLLCSHNSTSGYSIGEGAVECIIGEDDAGGCSKTGVGGDDGSTAVAQRAYNMCDGQRGALPNTHATLVATLFTSGSAVLVAPIQTSSSNVTTTSSRTSTTATSSRSTSTEASTSSSAKTVIAPTTTVASTVPLTIATGSPTLSSTTISEAPSLTTALPASTTAAITSSTGSSSSKLGTGQVVGISVGTVSGVAVAVGLIVFLYFLRKRRRNKDRDSDIFPFAPESNNSMAARRFTEYGRRHGQGQAEKGRISPGFGPGGTSDGVAAKISPTFYPRNPSPTPQSGPTIRLVEDRNLRADPSVRASRIGLAVSAEPSPAVLLPPPNFNEKNDRKHSQLLPEKPTLALQIPKDAHTRPGQVFNFPSPPKAQASIMNRGRPRIKFGPPLPSFSSPNIGGGQKDVGNGNREMANTLNKNFVPYTQNENTPYEQNMALRKYLASDQNMLVRPLEVKKQEQQQQQQQQQPPVTLQFGYGGAYRQVHEKDGFNGYGNTARPTNPFQNPYGPQYQYTSAEAQVIAPKKTYNPYSYQRSGARRDSNGSVTSFESFESGDDIELTSPGGTVTVSRKSNGPIDRRKSSGKIIELSPVKESPSPAGVAVSPVEYPKIPGKSRLGTSVKMIPPPPQPDFTKVMGSGAVGRKPVPSSLQTGYGNDKPWRQAELVAAAQRRSSIYNANINYSNASNSEQPPMPRPASSVYSTLPSQRTTQTFQNQAFLQPPPTSTTIYTDRVSTTSTNSSLLAKRRGEKAAAGLTLEPTYNYQNRSGPNTNTNTNSNPNSNNKWRVLRDSEIQDAKSPGWRPRTGTGVSSYTEYQYQGQNQNQRQGGKKKSPGLSQNPWRVSRDAFLDNMAAMGYGGGKENYEFDYWKKGNGNDNGGGNGYGYENGNWNGRVQEQQPGTPGWKPRLTPTRRGDELFLSVTHER